MTIHQILTASFLSVKYHRVEKCFCAYLAIYSFVEQESLVNWDIEPLVNLLLLFQVCTSSSEVSGVSVELNSSVLLLV